MEQEFKSINIDLEKGVYLLNGNPVGLVCELSLVFKNGLWSLCISEDKFFQEPQCQDRD